MTEFLLTNCASTHHVSRKYKRATHMSLYVCSEVSKEKAGTSVEVTNHLVVHHHWPDFFNMTLERISNILEGITNNTKNACT